MSQPPPPNSDPQPPTPEPSIQQQAENSTLGGGQQAAIGDDNIQIRGDRNWIVNTLNILLGQQTIAPVENSARSESQKRLLNSVKHEVAIRLRSSLHNAVIINLSKQLQLEQVKRPWDAEIKIGSKPSFALSGTTSILEVFEQEEIAGRLLILGAPGSGKTTTQLELAQALIARAEAQRSHPIPILLNLSSWKDDRQSMTEWLVAELKSKYGIPAQFSKEWIENRQLLPLLDGLDELEPIRQEFCVRSINQLLQGEYRPQYLIVCSRSEEYVNHKTQLQLNGAICLQPLTEPQIRDYLTDVKYPDLWQTISCDSALLELVTTPLLLSIAILTYQDISVEQWQQLTSTSERIRCLLDAYVGRMLTRQINSGAYVKQKPPTSKQTRLWLIWLSQQMQKEFQTEFLIEKMQPNWLSDRLVYLYRLTAGLILGIVVGPIVGLSNRVIIGISFGVFCIILFIFEPIISSWEKSQVSEIKTIENLKLSREKIKKVFITSLSIIPITIIFGLMTTNGHIIYRLSFWFVCAIVLWLFVLLLGGIDSSDIEIKKIPNQGIWNSVLNAGVIGMIVSLTMSGVAFIVSGNTTYSLEFGLKGMLLGALPSGLFTCIKHFSLRLILYSSGYIPCNYARFLNYCTERMFLQRVGGRYRFIHKLLQEHFAQMPVDSFK